MNWRNKTLYERIIDRWGELDSEYSIVNHNREAICTYFRSDEIVETDDAGNLVGDEIWNGHGSWFSRMMGTGFQGAIVSKNLPWIRYVMEHSGLKGVDELDSWLQAIGEHMSDCYQRSNFYDLQPQFTHDGVTTGSPVLLGQEDLAERRTMWLPQHYKSVRIYYDKFNLPEGIIIKDKTWTAKKIFDKFVVDDDAKGTKRRKKLNLSVNSALDGGRLNEKYTVYTAIFRASDPIWNGKDEKPFKKPVGAWKWLTACFLELTDQEREKQNTPLNEDMGDFTQPFAVWNYDKKRWDTSSRTPAFYAIWDNLSLQQIDKNYLEDIQNANRRAFFALNSMQNRIDLSPEGENYISKEEFDYIPRFVDKVQGLEFSKDLMELKVDSLRRWFMIDFFQMFTDMLKQHKQPVTATQIWQMAGEKASLLSPAVETHGRYLETIDAFMMDVEIRAGRGPFDPQTVENIADVIAGAIGQVPKINVRPVFIGPLAQAQKVTQSMQPIRSTIAAATESLLFDLDPDLRIAIRGHKTLAKIADANDFPEDCLMPEDEYNEVKAALAEKRAKDEQLAKALEIAKASKDVSGKVEPDSILGAVAGAAG